MTLDFMKDKAGPPIPLESLGTFLWKTGILPNLRRMTDGKDQSICLIPEGQCWICPEQRHDSLEAQSRPPSSIPHQAQPQLYVGIWPVSSVEQQMASQPQERAL
jgi:hypothetical protein